MRTRLHGWLQAAFLLWLALAQGQAWADFSGYYALRPMNTGNWTLNFPEAISPRSNSSSVQIASNVGDDTQLTVVAQQAGTVSAQLGYNARQSSGAGYLINGQAYSSGSGRVSFQVKAGDTFGFYIGSTPARYAPSPSNAPGTLNISNFSPPSSPTCASGATAAPIISAVVPDMNSASVMFNYCPPEGQTASYTVTAQPGGLSGSGTVTPVVVSNLDSYTNYSFTVTATVGSNSYTSNPVSAKTLCQVSDTQRGCRASPPMPQAPSITSVTMGSKSMQVGYSYSGPPQTLQFQAQATSLTSGEIYRSALGNSNPLTINGLTPGHSYTVLVTAYNSAQFGHNSDPVKAGLAQLVIKEAAAGNQSVRLVFSNVNGSDSDANISVTATPTGGGVPVSAQQISSPYLLQGLKNGVSYTVTLTGSNRYGSNSSISSAPFTPGTVPGVPQGLQVQQGNGQATISFVPPADNGGSAITKYLVVAEPGNIVVPVLASPAIVQGLNNGQTYNIRVMAHNLWGNSAAASSGPYIPGTLPLPPTPRNIIIGNGQAEVAFTPAADVPGLPISYYTVTATPPAGTASGPVTATGKGSPLLLRGLSNGLPYQLSLSATNVLGTSPSQNAGTLVTSAQPNQPVIQSVSISGNVATVSFYQGQPGYDPAQQYTVNAFVAGPVGLPLGSGISVSGPTSPLTLPPLPWGQNYQFQVTAQNSTGPSLSSLSGSYGMQRSRWMTGLPDTLPLGKLMIPGTHDSGSYETILDLGETQDWDVAEQLDNGIRFLDVRVADSGLCRQIKLQNYPFEVRHGFVCLGNFQTEVMNPVNTFLANNSGETVLMSVKDEDTLNTSLFMQTVINNPANGFVTQAGPATPLSTVRGKIVLFDRFDAGTGVPWGQNPPVATQDEYDLDQNCYFVWAGGWFPWFDCSIDYPAKARKVVEFLNLANQQQGQGAAPKFWINFASAQWNGMYIGNSAEVANAAVNEYFGQINKMPGGQPPRRFGSAILMDYPNRQGDKVINSLLNFNRVAQ